MRERLYRNDIVTVRLPKSSEVNMLRQYDGTVQRVKRSHPIGTGTNYTLWNVNGKNGKPFWFLRDWLVLEGDE